MLSRSHEGATLSTYRAGGAGSDRRWPGWSPRQTLPGAAGAYRVLLLVAVAAAIPVLLFGGWVAYLIAEHERADARWAASETAERVTERVGSQLSAQLQVAEALAASAALDGPDLQAFYTEAERLKASRPLWHTIQLADPSGAQVLNLLRPSDATLGPTVDRASFERVVRTGRPAIGGIGPVGIISGQRLVALRVPVMRDGQLSYVLSVALAPDGVRSILRGAGAPEDWIGAIVDAEGRIIARTLGEEVDVGRLASSALRNALERGADGFYSDRTLDGVEVETVYRTLPSPAGWSVHFAVPREVLNAPVHRSLYVMAGGGLASLLLAAGLALLVAREIAQRRRDEAVRSAVALKASEERGAVAVEAADLGTWRWDIDQGVVVGSERCRTLLDLPASPADDGGIAWGAGEFLDAVHQDDRDALVEAVRRCLLEDDAIVDVEFRALSRDDGGPRWLRATGRSQRPVSGPRESVHGVIADIEPRKRAEAERRDLLRRTAQAQENEQRRIARELHDQVGQTVTGLSLGLKGLERALERQGAGQRLRRQVRWLQGLTMGIGRDIHRAASDLRPTALDDLGLHRALVAYASSWSQRCGVGIDVQALGSDARLPAEIETTAYRVVQEALTNVLKHAAARNVSVVLERKVDGLRVIVEDDGRGFDPERAPEVEGVDEDGRVRHRIGLSGMRERLGLVGGTMTLESAPDAGTALFVRIPIAPTERRAGGA